MCLRNCGKDFAENSVNETGGTEQKARACTADCGTILQSIKVQDLYGRFKESFYGSMSNVGAVWRPEGFEPGTLTYVKMQWAAH